MREPDLTGDVTNSPALAWVKTGPELARAMGEVLRDPVVEATALDEAERIARENPLEPQARVWRLRERNRRVAPPWSSP